LSQAKAVPGTVVTVTNTGNYTSLNLLLSTWLKAPAVILTPIKG